MEKFLITEKSHNRITGPMMVTTSPRRSCPVACPLRKTANSDTKGGCYAEHGFLGGFIWTKLDRLELGQSFKQGQIKVYSLDDLTHRIRALLQIRCGVTIKQAICLAAIKRQLMQSH